MEVDITLAIVDTLLNFISHEERLMKFWRLKPTDFSNYDRLTNLSPTEENTQLFPETAAISAIQIPLIFVVQYYGKPNVPHDLYF